MDLEEISLDIPLEEADDKLLVETEAGRTLLEIIHVRDDYRLVAHLPDGRKVDLDHLPPERSLRQAVAAMSSARPLRAFRLPAEGEIASHIHVFRAFLSYVPFVIGAGAAVLGIAWESLGFLRFVLLVVGLSIGMISYDALSKSMRFREWVLELRGDRTKAAEFELPGLPEEIEIDDIKAEYGRLLSDIVYRIENPALFDPHEPTSKQFTLALLQWDNNDGVVGDDERRELALRVRSTFEAARANAERLGMNYLPAEARDRAGTALKAARLAVDESAAEGERENALRRAVEILDELALYFLPSGAEARKAITGRAPLQLPGRRSG